MHVFSLNWGFIEFNCFSERMVVYDNQEPQDLRIESKHHPEVDSKANIPDLTRCSVIRAKTVSSPVPALASINRSNIQVKGIPKLLPSSASEIVLNSSNPSSSMIKGMNITTSSVDYLPASFSQYVSTPCLPQKPELINCTDNNNSIHIPQSLLNQLNSSNLVQVVMPPKKKKKKKTSSPLSRNDGGKVQKLNAPKKERLYTPEQLATALDLVIENKNTPVQVIKSFSIPRRTFFRHLKNRRDELGITPKQEIEEEVPSGSVSPSDDEEVPSEIHNQIYNPDGSTNREGVELLLKRLTGVPRESSPKDEEMDQEVRLQPILKKELPDESYSWESSQQVCSPSTSRGVSIVPLKSK